MIAIMFERLFATIPGAQVKAFGAGDAVFRQGDAARAIFQVQTGAVAMVRHLADGALLTVAVAGPREAFAEASLFAEHYHCDAIARAKSEVLSVPSDLVRQKIASDAALAGDLAKSLSGQVRDLRARLEIQRIKRAPERVLAWLCWRARGNPPAVEVADAWSRVASELGLSPEALYRALRALEVAERIERRGRQVTLLGARRG